MKKLGVLVAVLVGVLVGFFLWMARLPPFDGYAEPVEVAFADLHVSLHESLVQGTAHYPVVVAVQRAGTLGRPDTTWWIFPFFGPGDTMGRQISAMAMSRVEPDDLVGFEDLTLACDVRPPGVAMTPEAERAFREAGYSFAQDYVLLEQLPLED